MGHKVARLNRKSFFYLNHHRLVHFLSDRSQQKVNLHYSLFQLFRFQMSIEKTILKESHPVLMSVTTFPVTFRSDHGVVRVRDKSVVYHLPKFSGKSSWKVSGTRLFESFQRKIFGSKGTSEKAVLFFRTEYSNQKFAVVFR